jgi:hypothetical protein
MAGWRIQNYIRRHGSGAGIGAIIGRWVEASGTGVCPDILVQTFERSPHFDAITNEQKAGAHDAQKRSQTHAKFTFLLRDEVGFRQ